MSADAWYECPKCMAQIDLATKAALRLVQEKGFKVEARGDARMYTMSQDG